MSRAGIGSAASGQRVTSEDQLLITETGVEIISDDPFEARLLE